MKLPRFQSGPQKSGAQMVNFRGINWSEQVQEGDLSDSIGLSLERYPILSQRTDREPVLSMQGVSDFFAWDGHLVSVRDDGLYLDDEAIDNITPGKKQWAVVNTKLCIWPDMVYVDLTNHRFGRFDEAVQTTGVAESAALTSSSLRADLYSIIQKDVTGGAYGGSATEWNPYVYTYGTDVEAVIACWVDGAWDMDALGTLETSSGFFSDRQVDEWMHWDPGRIFIPSKTNNQFGYIAGDAGVTEPDRSKYNTEGYYAVFTYCTSADEGDPYVGVDRSSVMWHFDVFQVGVSTKLFSTAFSVGHAVNISGTPYGIADGERLRITGIDDITNTLSFAENSLNAPVAFRVLTEALVQDSAYYLRYGDRDAYTYCRFSAEENVPAGMIVYAREGDNEQVYIWDPENKKTLYIWPASIGTYQGSGTLLSGTLYNTLEMNITIQRVVPAIDFICESGNRLWGVGNAQNNTIYNAQTGEYETYTSRCIYASALGAPEQFYDYSGLATDSYAVAVGSDGDFTAICSYGGNVCCFKEHRMVKVIGSFPAEYYIAEYEVAGVQAGSEKSLVSINEVLYYKGTNGVYAYGGGVPQKISGAFGTRALKDACAGRYRDCYYMSAKKNETDGVLLCYSPTTGLWIKEANSVITAMEDVKNDLYFLKEDKTVTKTAERTDEALEWMAEFTPFDETAHIHKGYTFLRLRLTMRAGAWLKAEVRQDQKPWSTVWTQRATDDMTMNIPLRIGRCDRFAVRLSGRGRTDIRSMVREFTVQSEV